MKSFFKLLLAISLLINAALAAVLVAGAFTSKPNVDTETAAAAAARTAAAAKAASTNVDVWSTIKSDDLPGLVAHLRAAGFPARLVRAILAAQIRDQFAARRKAIEGNSADGAFWKNATIDPKQQLALRELSREQQKMLRDLLGPDADSDDSIGSAYRDRGLTGLPAAKVSQVRQILQDFDEQRQDLYATIAMGGMVTFGSTEQAKMRAIEQAQHAELAKVLTPAELENYDLMTSNIAQSLRYQLSAFNPTEDEFRALFKIQQDSQDKMAPVMGMMTPDEMRARQDAQKQLNAQVELALGNERYADYQRATDYNYRQTTLLVARLELPADTANQLYAIQKDYQQRRMDLQASTSPEDRAQQLAALQQEAIAKVTPILGSDKAVEAYKQYGGNWIKSMVPRGPVRPGAATQTISTGAVVVPKT